MFKMNQLDAYISEFQRRYRVYRRRKEKPVWLYSSYDHSVNPAYCPECGTIPCMVQQFDPVLECMVSPHMQIIPPKRAGTAYRPPEQNLDPIMSDEAAYDEPEADLNGDELLDSKEFKDAYNKWEANQKRVTKG